MDPIGSSCYNLHSEEDDMLPNLYGTQFSETIASCKSLSHYEGKKFKAVLPQIIAAGIAGSLHIVFGVSLAFSAILIPQLIEEQNSTDPNALHVTKAEKSWITSCITIVAPPAAIIGGFVMDSLGRLNTLKLSTIPCSLGWVLVATGSNVPTLLAGRMLIGAASIVASNPAVVYVTEIGRPDIRGSLIALLPFYISIGMVTVYTCGWFMNWRLISWLCNILIIVPFILLMFIPESPAWLVSRGRTEEAKKSLDWFNKYQPQPQHKSETFAEMQLSVLQKEHMVKMEEREKMVGNSVLKKVKLFLQPSGYKPLLILTGLFLIQQFSGIFIIIFNGVVFFKDIGTEINPYMAAVGIGIMRLIMTLANTWLMRRFNRRSLLMVSTAGMGVCMAVSGLYTKWLQEETSTQQWVPLSMLMGYFILAAMGLMTIPFSVNGELFPIAIRGVSLSLVMAIANVMMFAALQSYHSLYELFGGSSGLQYFFAIVSFGACVFAYVFMPETHRKKLSEIEEYFWHHTTYLSVPSRRKTAKQQAVYTSINNNFMDAKSVMGKVKQEAV